jgi:hypothetical protein
MRRFSVKARHEPFLDPDALWDRPRRFITTTTTAAGHARREPVRRADGTGDGALLGGPVVLPMVMAFQATRLYGVLKMSVAS